MPKQQLAWKPHDLIVLHNKANSVVLVLPTGRQRLDKDHMILTEAQILQLPEVKSLVESGALEVLDRKAYPTFRQTRAKHNEELKAKGVS